MNSNQKGQIVQLTDNGASINWTDNTGLSVNIQKSLIEFVSNRDNNTVQIGLYSGLLFTIFYWENVTVPEGITSADDLVTTIQGWIGSGGGGTQYWDEWDESAIINNSVGGVLSKFETEELVFIVSSTVTTGLQMAIIDKGTGNIKSQVFLAADQTITIRNVDPTTNDVLSSIVLESEKVTLSNKPGSSMSMFIEGSTQNFNFTGVPSYQNHNAATNDTNLASGSVYKINGSENLHIK